MDLFEILQSLNEMASPRAHAIDICISLGEEFIEHFKEICQKGVSDRDFKHHCQELQAWYDKIKKIVIKQTNKKISKIQMIDWFFTCGSSLEELFDDDDIQTKYEEFIIKLLESDDLIVNILYKILIK